jgi:hypothetical protein
MITTPAQTAMDLVFNDKWLARRVSTFVSAKPMPEDNAIHSALLCGKGSPA